MYQFRSIWTNLYHFVPTMDTYMDTKLSWFFYKSTRLLLFSLNVLNSPNIFHQFFTTFLQKIVNFRKTITLRNKRLDFRSLFIYYYESYHTSSSRNSEGIHNQKSNGVYSAEQWGYRTNGIEILHIELRESHSPYF